MLLNELTIQEHLFYVVYLTNEVPTLIEKLEEQGPAGRRLG